jgi:WD40 repeat protein/predicted Ser/Thr protein kinase
VPADFYRIEAEVGRGGVGVVVRAHDRRLDRQVALKQLQHVEPRSRLRFEREMRITAKLQHPGVVPIHEAGVLPSGEPFYAMKLIEGRSLKELIAERQTMQARLELLSTVVAVIETMAYAHSQGVIHRDLKPSNVIVGAYGETVVIDWGLAKDLGAVDDAAPPAGPYRDASPDGMTMHGQVVGTPAYMAPEQARGEEVRKPADVYALGAVLRQLVTGAPPYPARSSAEMVAAVTAGPPAALDLVAPDAPRDLCAVIDKAMARDAASRYADAAGLLADLRRFMNGLLVTAYAYAATERLRKWAARRRGVVLTAVAFTAVLIVGGTISITRVIEERDDAVASRRAVVAKANALLREQAGREIDKRNVVRAFEILKEYPREAEDWNLVFPLIRRIGMAGLPDAWTFGTLHSDKTASMGIDPVSGFVVVANGSHLEIWNPGRKTLEERIDLPGTPRRRLSIFGIAPTGSESRALLSLGNDTITILPLPKRSGDHVRAPASFMVCESSSLSDVAWARDSGRLAVGCNDGRVVVVDGSRIVDLARHSPGATMVAFLGDDSVVSSGDDGLLKVTRLDKSAAERDLELGAPSAVVTTRPSCSQTVIGTVDGRIEVVSTSADAHGSRAHTFRAAEKSIVGWVGLDPDCRLAFGLSNARQLTVADLVSEKVIFSGPASSARFYGSNHGLIIGNDQGEVTYFEPLSGWKQSWRVSSDPIVMVDSAPDGSFAAFGELVAWFRPERIADVHPLASPSWALAALLDESQVLVGESKGGVAAFDPAANSVQELGTVHDGTVLVRAGEHLLYSVGVADGCVSSWRESGSSSVPVSTELFCVPGGIRDLAAFGDDAVFASSPHDVLVAWDGRSGRLTAANVGPVNRLSAGRPDSVLATLQSGQLMAMDGTLHVRRLTTPGPQLTSAQELSTGRDILLDGMGHLTLLAADGSNQLLGDCKGVVTRPWISPTREEVIASCRDGRILVWPPVEGIDQFSFEGPTTDVDGSIDGRRFAGASASGTAMVVDRERRDALVFNSMETLDNIELLTRRGLLIATSHDRGLLAVWKITEMARRIPLDERASFAWLHEGD